MTSYEHLVEERFALPAEDGPSRHMDVAEALDLVRPGMTLHFQTTHTRPFGLLAALVRRFAGSSPGFTFVALSLSDTALAALDLGLVARLITTFVGNSYPTPGPNPRAADAIRRHGVEVEHWTLLTLVQRLRAGAEGLPFAVTRSIVGTSMERNPGVRLIDDATRPGERVALLDPLRVDLAFVQAMASDVAGNAVVPHPLGEGPWAALGAREGVVVGAERIVDTAAVRRASHQVLVPGCRVRAVVEMRLGGHPKGHPSQGYADGAADSYADDYETLTAARDAARAGPEPYRRFLDEWVLAEPDAAGVEGRLPADRRAHLLGARAPDRWRVELARRLAELPAPYAPPTAAERAIVHGAHVLVAAVRELGVETILAGIGPSNLAAWLAELELRRAGTPVRLMAELGYLGYLPRPGDPFLFNLDNAPTCTRTSDILDVLGCLVSGHGSRALGALATGQVDRHGNLNTTRLADGRWLTGSGGGSDVASGALATVVVTVLVPGRFVAELPYVTSPGRRVRWVVTDRCVLEKQGDELALAALAPGVDAERDVEPLVGWALDRHPVVARLPEPTPEELALIRLFDPAALFRG